MGQLGGGKNELGFYYSGSYSHFIFDY